MAPVTFDTSKPSIDLGFYTRHISSLCAAIVCAEWRWQIDGNVCNFWY